MKDIQNREDINVLVKAFYSKIRKDELLGDIFNSHIPDETWPSHLEKLTDFWEANLFGTTLFRGNPARKHLSVDKNLNHSIEQKHFDRWVNLWFDSIDKLYEGEVAKSAKSLAKRIGEVQFMMITSHRK